jgi:pimeloyl-ACP methyl ester carboxylesterase
MSAINIKGKKANYEVLGEGDGDIFFFVHGWGGTIESLRRLATYLINKKRSQAVILDLPGFGKSDNPDKDWGVGEYSKFLQQFIEKIKQTLNKKGADIVYFGHSFGGSLGIYLAANKMIEIKTLVLCCSSYKRRKVASSKYLKMKNWGEKNIPFFNFLVKPLILPLYRVLFPHSDISKFPHLENNFRKIVTEDLSDLPEKINIPTLIIGAGKDTATPIELAEELHKKIKKSELKIFPEATHGLPLKQPDEVGEVLLNYC